MNSALTLLSIFFLFIIQAYGGHVSKAIIDSDSEPAGDEAPALDEDDEEADSHEDESADVADAESDDNQDSASENHRSRLMRRESTETGKPEKVAASKAVDSDEKEAESGRADDPENSRDENEASEDGDDQSAAPRRVAKVAPVKKSAVAVKSAPHRKAEEGVSSTKDGDGGGDGDGGKKGDDGDEGDDGDDGGKKAQDSGNQQDEQDTSASSDTSSEASAKTENSGDDSSGDDSSDASSDSADQSDTNDPASFSEEEEEDEQNPEEMANTQSTVIDGRFRGASMPKSKHKMKSQGKPRHKHKRKHATRDEVPGDRDNEAVEAKRRLDDFDNTHKLHRHAAGPASFVADGEDPDPGEGPDNIDAPDIGDVHNDPNQEQSAKSNSDGTDGGAEGDVPSVEDDINYRGQEATQAIGRVEKDEEKSVPAPPPGFVDDDGWEPVPSAHSAPAPAPAPASKTAAVAHRSEELILDEDPDEKMPPVHKAEKGADPKKHAPSAHFSTSKKTASSKSKGSTKHSHAKADAEPADEQDSSKGNADSSDDQDVDQQDGDDDSSSSKAKAGADGDADSSNSAAKAGADAGGNDDDQDDSRKESEVQTSNKVHQIKQHHRRSQSSAKGIAKKEAPSPVAALEDEDADDAEAADTAGTMDLTTAGGEDEDETTASDNTEEFEDAVSFVQTSSISSSATKRIVGQRSHRHPVDNKKTLPATRLPHQARAIDH